MPTRDRSPSSTTTEIVTQIGYLKRAQIALGNGRMLPDWQEFRECIAGANRIPRHHDVIAKLTAIEPSIPGIYWICAEVRSAMRVIGARLLEEFGRIKSGTGD